MPKYFVIGCVFMLIREREWRLYGGKGNRAKRWEKEYNIHDAIKLLYKLEFRHHISTSRIAVNMMKSKNVTKTDVCIFIFVFTIK